MDSEKLPLNPRQMLERVDKNPKVSSTFALVFLVVFCLALLLSGYFHWSKPCDTPLAGFLVSYSLVGLFCAAFFYIVAFTKNAPGAARRGGLSPSTLLGLIAFSSFVITGFTGTSYYKGAHSCESTSPGLYKWAFAAVLSFLIFMLLFISVPLIKSLLPIFGKLLKGLVFGLTGFTNALSFVANGLMVPGMDGMEVGGAGAGSASAGGIMGTLFGPGGSPGSVSGFTYFVNTTALCWFFTYFLYEVSTHWKQECDSPLHFFLLVFAVFGLLFSLIGFYYSMLFAGLVRLPPRFPDRKKRFFALLILWLIWGGLGAFWVNTSNSCAESSPTIFRLSFLLTLSFYFLVAVLISGGICVGFDWLCSGRLRVVVVLDNN